MQIVYPVPCHNRFDTLEQFDNQDIVEDQSHPSPVVTKRNNFTSNINLRKICVINHMNKARMRSYSRRVILIVFQEANKSILKLLPEWTVQLASEFGAMAPIPLQVYTGPKTYNSIVSCFTEGYVNHVFQIIWNLGFSAYQPQYF